MFFSVHLFKNNKQTVTTTLIQVLGISVLDSCGNTAINDAIYSKEAMLPLSFTGRSSIKAEIPLKYHFSDI